MFAARGRNATHPGGEIHVPGGSEVLLDRDGAVATITLDAPERRNALTPSMAAAFVDACEQVDRDPAIGALVVRGAGGFFCAGADVQTLDDAGRDPSHPDAYERISAIYAAFTRLGAVAVPTVAAVHGAAVGAGLNLLLATDLRIVARDARLLSGFLRRGIHPGGGHFVLLSRTAGREATAAMALFDEEVDGDRAVSLGLAWRSVSVSDVDTVARDLARRAARDPALARAAAASFRRETGPPGVPWEVASSAERATQMWSMRRQADQ